MKDRASLEVRFAFAQSLSPVSASAFFDFCFPRPQHDEIWFFVFFAEWKLVIVELLLVFAIDQLL
ncbi:hypothetical protein EAH74_12340 [Pseudomonas mandelii]|uniref:Uncharacterized protein n=1 Tax=Pseudomonas mandelii TaxID=75612 RepID=A0A502IF80_9PSED|nr:hypothetical protein EAH74_12340 [Pseudomonas mandelii]